MLASHSGHSHLAGVSVIGGSCARLLADGNPIRSTLPPAPPAPGALEGVLLQPREAQLGLTSGTAQLLLHCAYLPTAPLSGISTRIPGAASQPAPPPGPVLSETGAPQHRGLPPARTAHGGDHPQVPSELSAEEGLLAALLLLRLGAGPQRPGARHPLGGISRGALQQAARGPLAGDKGVQGAASVPT